MKQFLLLIIAITFIINKGLAQFSKKEEKTIEKSIMLYDEKEYDKAIEKFAPVLEAHKFNPKLWDINIEFYFQEYQKTYKSVSFLMDALGDVKVDNANGTSSSVSISSEGNFGLDAFISQCYRSTRLIENHPTSSIYLRHYLIDPPVDTAIAADAIAAFNGAEVEFQKKNYDKAIELYQKAIDFDPSFYRASLNLGDCHWAAGRPEKAVEYFKKAMFIHPKLLEPRKYLTDAYMEMGAFDKALTACIGGIIAYPDSDMFRRLKEICYKQNIIFDRHWVPRDFDLNQHGVKQDDSLESPWNYYREAKKVIEPYCNKEGLIILENELTKQQYMEVFCWEYMLNKTDDKQFDFARTAMTAGYLDCYALVSMYHISLHSQFEDFKKYEVAKIKDYFKLLLIEK